MAAPLDVVLTDMVELDFLFVVRAHFGRISEANLQGLPDLAVELDGRD